MTLSRTSGEWDNTLFFYITGDNGAYAEGTVRGAWSAPSFQNGVPEDPEWLLQHLYYFGSPHCENHYNIAWAWVAGQPVPVDQEGGLPLRSHPQRDGRLMATRHREPGGLRSQFHHVTDVVPTILDVAGIEQPETVKGIPQKPLMPPATHTTQYFEILGNRALYHDGWIACFHGRLPWTRSHAVPFHATPEQWELYDVRNDFSQADDLAGSHPDTLAELGSMLDVEHRAYGVYPLSDVTTSRALPYNRPSYVDGVSTVTLFDDCVRLPEMATINVKNTSFHLKARPTVPADVEGVVIRPGGSMAGWSIYVHDGIPTYVYNWLGHELSFARATEPLPVGDVELGLRFRYDGGGVGKGGDAEVTVDGRPVGQCRVARTVPFVFSSPGRPLTSVAQRVRRSDRTSPTSPSRASCAGSRSPSIPS